MSELHVILVNLGTPGAPREAEIRAFLLEFLSDPMVVDYPSWFWQPILRGIVLRSRPRRLVESYQSIWQAEGAPLLVGTRAIVEGLAARLTGSVAVCDAYRYGSPSLEDRLAAARGAGARAVVIPLFPHRTGSTTGSIERETQKVSTRLGIRDRVSVAIPEPDACGFAAATGDRFRQALKTAGVARPDHVVVSFHGIPRRYDRREGGLYRSDCERTTRAVLESLEWPEKQATLSYQSRFGPEAWLTPATDKVLSELPCDGCRTVCVLTPGFVTDGLETLEEIRIRGKETFERSGGHKLVHVPAVADHPNFLDTLESLVGRSS